MPTITLKHCVPYIIYESVPVNTLPSGARIEAQQGSTGTAGNGSVATNTYGQLVNELSATTGNYVHWGVGGLYKIALHYTKIAGQPEEIAFTFEWKGL